MNPTHTPTPIKELICKSRPLALRIKNGKIFARKLGRHIWVETPIGELEPEVRHELELIGMEETNMRADGLITRPIEEYNKLVEANKQAKALVDILVKLYPDGHEHDLSFKLADGTYSDCIWCDAVKVKVSLTQALALAEKGE